MKKTIALILVLALCLGAQSVAASQPTFTLMVYMCGADLESEDGMGTRDLEEMMSAGLMASSSVRVIVATGGSKTWHMSGIDASTNQYFEVGTMKLVELKDAGRQDMCNSATLGDFVAYAMDYAPADRYGLILWDHGSGPLRGFGYDERFRGGRSMAVPDLASAVTAALDGRRLSFIGFDACLMSSVECAYVLKDAADCLIASQGLEPGEGWDYEGLLDALKRDPSISVEALGRQIVDGFIADANRSLDRNVMLSVVDLSKIDAVCEALGVLGSALSQKHTTAQLTTIANARSGMHSFGEDDEEAFDLVDIGALCDRLGAVLPVETARLKRATEAAVTYSRRGLISSARAGGLSVYFPYAVPQNARAYKMMYGDRALLRYAQFAEEFADELVQGGGWSTGGSSAGSVAGAIQEGGLIASIGDLVQSLLGDDAPQPTPAPIVPGGLWEGLDSVQQAAQNESGYPNLWEGLAG